MSRRAVLTAAGAATAALVGAAWVRRVVLPARPDDAGTARPHRVPDPERRPSPDGTGVTIAVNRGSGPVWSSDPTDALREGLPGAQIRLLDGDDDITDVLGEGDPVAVGAAGGDGTLSAAAEVAVSRDLVLVAVPSGTFNHLARDLGLDDVSDAIAAVRAGTAIHMDLGVVDISGGATRTFVNTLTFGGYTQVVDARERLQPRLGKWLALLVCTRAGAAPHGAPRARPGWASRRGLAGLDRELCVCAGRLRTVVARAPGRRAPRRAARARGPTVRARAVRRRRVDRTPPALPRVPGAARRDARRCGRCVARCDWQSTARRSTAERPSTSRNVGGRCSWPCHQLDAAGEGAGAPAVPNRVFASERRDPARSLMRPAKALERPPCRTGSRL